MKITRSFVAIGICLLAACAAATPRGVVVMRISVDEAHVCIRREDVKVGQKVDLYRNVCKRSPAKPVLSRCDLRRSGAGRITERLNDHYAVVRVEGGVGKVTLDFGGSWTTTQKADLSLSVGELRLRLPRRTPVRIRMDKFLSSFEPEGLIRRGDSWVTRNFDPEQPHLDIGLTCSVGAVRLEWVN